jgi:hypothetical protein
MKLTRRELAAALAAAPVLAQDRARPDTPDATLNAARERLKATGAALARQQVPMAVEPAFQFKA